ncbi:ABC transporter [Halorhodospira halochloris]|nr:ABC transporter [Halorhodospira halochloris]
MAVTSSNPFNKQPLLKIKELRAGYSQPVVGPLTANINPGEVVGFTGPNGSGKSTIMRVLTGQARAFSGQIAPAPGINIACQAQSPYQGGELPLRGKELLALMGAEPEVLPQPLHHLLNRRVDRLSGGQRQSLIVWSVIGHSGELILLDEPTNNLDSQGRELLIEGLNNLSEHRGALVISHDHEFVRQVCCCSIPISPSGIPSSAQETRQAA